MIHPREPQCLRIQHTGNSYREQIISLLDVCVHFTQQSVLPSPPPSCLEGNRVCYMHHLQPHWQVQGQYYLSKHEFISNWKFLPDTLGDFKTNRKLTSYSCLLIYFHRHTDKHLHIYLVRDQRRLLHFCRVFSFSRVKQMKQHLRPQ